MRSNIQGQLALRYLFKDLWLESFCWLTFLMSFFGIPLVLKWWGFDWLWHPADLIPVVQVAFVGSIYYPLAAFASWRRGKYLKESEWFSVFGAFAIAFVFGSWLGQEVFTVTVLVIAVTAPLVGSVIALLIKHVRRTNVA